MSLIRSWLLIFFILLQHTIVQAYSVPVHEEMSKNAYQASVLSATNGNFLQSLGLTQNQKFNGDTDDGLFIGTANDWIQKGSNFEDNNFRALNHFYDPTTGQGLHLYLPATDVINWGLKLQPCNIPNLDCGTLTQNWSIPDARSYLYRALTDPDPAVREANWANTFEALGHVIHLIQDMAQPQHVRNETHYETDNPFLFFLNFNQSGYEKYTKNKKDSLLYSGYPAVNFSDYISYWTTGYGSVWAAGRNGLADVTNEHFFSERAAFDCNGQICNQQGHYFPVINQTSGESETVDVSPNNNGTILGQMKFFPHTFTDPITGETVTNPKALSYSLFDIDLINQGKGPIFSQNRLTFNESQKILVKRAVGYSAGLLNHFFRGKFKVIAVPGGNGIQIQNISAETMTYFSDPLTGNSVGGFSVYYDDTSSYRQFLASYNLAGPLGPTELTPVISFSAPSNNIKPGQYIVVFRGKLGEEEGAVVGNVFREYIYYLATNSNGLKQVFRMDPDGTNLTLVYDNLAAPLDIGRLSVSPDGNKLAFGAGSPPQTAKIYLFDLTLPHQTTATLLTAGDAPAWSPDGTKIAFERESGLYLPSAADVEIFTIDSLSNIETQLTNIPNSSYSGNPAWSPDGSKIAYSRYNSNPQEPDCANFYVITLMTSLGQPLGPTSCDLNTAYSDFSPAWNPNGQALVFTRMHPNPSQSAEQLFQANLMTTPPTMTKLTDSNGIGFRELWPVWSPDGTRIAVGSGKNGNADIWLIDPNRDPNNSYLTNLTNGNLGSDQFPTFGR